MSAHIVGMNNVYYWSDPHFGHSFVAGLRGFSSVDDHDNHLINAWNSRVTKRDSIWVLGDLAAASPSRALEIIRHLPGTKHLVFGNHDVGHPGRRNAHRHHRQYLDVFDTVQSAASRTIGGRPVMLSHFPYDGDSHSEYDRHTQWRLRDEGGWLLHGHVHNEFDVRGTQINVGVDKWMDGPAPEADILALIEQQESAGYGKAAS
ncbi:metallophosphoesterase family protein [Arthrobacter sp. zg-Y1110]|uniref:metallophosphoesterase family protein n=1 Tax=Arthrobacter sp. zg-Y1110 TaxID=2886932 RepID=UPI001D133BB5|nr:metallophosphoesterase [Arthrobacter sp. zg-Y1110]MCC3292873.1 metallophosphoesterase [Arthrobacter sp. zg-Y1110]UWX86811.1 metallophosphoesterase [Arthrobacter sp. zg-Y1110]